jgi:predicted ATPase
VKAAAVIAAQTKIQTIKIFFESEAVVTRLIMRVTQFLIEEEQESRAFRGKYNYRRVYEAGKKSKFLPTPWLIAFRINRYEIFICISVKGAGGVGEAAP